MEKSSAEWLPWSQSSSRVGGCFAQMRTEWKAQWHLRALCHPTRAGRWPAGPLHLLFVSWLVAAGIPPRERLARDCSSWHVTSLWQSRSRGVSVPVFGTAGARDPAEAGGFEGKNFLCPHPDPSCWVLLGFHRTPAALPPRRPLGLPRGLALCLCTKLGIHSHREM